MNNDSFEAIKQISENIQKSVDVKTVFGDVVKNGEISVIPVSSLDFKAGGLTGKSGGYDILSGERKGFGTGMSIKAKPIGYIELKNDESKFINIIDATKFSSAFLITLAMMIAYLILSTLRSDNIKN